MSASISKHRSCAGRACLLAVVVAVFALLQPLFAQQSVDGASIKRGEYVLNAAGCVACHTRQQSKATDTLAAQSKGPRLAGGRALHTPFGTFYSPNITADKDHGIGAWSANDLWRALTEGEGPGAVHYYPVFPFPSYSAMKRSDVDDLYHYLMSVKAQPIANQEHDLSWFVSWRFTNWVWKLLFYDPQILVDDPTKSKVWNRGAYLVNVLGHCGECHSPRAANGVVQRALHLSGNPQGPEGEPVPSLRGDAEQGVKDWTVNDIVTYLRSGEDPEFDFAGGAMVEVIDDSTSKLSDEDLNAIAQYLKDLPLL